MEMRMLLKKTPTLHRNKSNNQQRNKNAVLWNRITI